MLCIVPYPHMGCRCLHQGPNSTTAGVLDRKSHFFESKGILAGEYESSHEVTDSSTRAFGLP